MPSDASFCNTSAAGVDLRNLRGQTRQVVGRRRQHEAAVLRAPAAACRDVRVLHWKGGDDHGVVRRQFVCVARWKSVTFCRSARGWSVCIRQLRGRRWVLELRRRWQFDKMACRCSIRGCPGDEAVALHLLISSRRAVSRPRSVCCDVTVSPTGVLRPGCSWTAFRFCCCVRSWF
jgi:hypothetical protein